MKVAVWNYYSFSFVGSYEIAGDFSPSWDLLTPQSSVMKIAGDTLIEKMMVVAVPLPHGRSFIGIVNDVKKNESGITEVTAKEILSILDVPIVTEMFSSTDYASGPNGWLYDQARDYFTNNSDSYQTLSWLYVYAAAGTAASSPAWSSNETSTLLSALEEFVDAYGSLATFAFNSTNTAIECTLTYSSSLTSYTFDLRGDCFSKISYSDNSEVAVNKVVYKPMSDNYIHHDTEYPFVLLSDGTISTNLNDALRLTPVVSQIEFYSDEDLGGSSTDTTNIASSASEVLNVAKYSHEVKFRMRYHKTSSYLQTAFASLICGTIVTLYGIPGHESEAISTKVTRVQMVGENEIEVTCGYSRSQLTDKIKMHDRIEKGGKRLSYGLVSETEYMRITRTLDGTGTYYTGTDTFVLPEKAIITKIYGYAEYGTYRTVGGTTTYEPKWRGEASVLYDDQYDSNYPVDLGNGYKRHIAKCTFPASEWHQAAIPEPNPYYKFCIEIHYMQIKTSNS